MMAVPPNKIVCNTVILKPPEEPRFGPMIRVFRKANRPSILIDRI